MKSFKAFFQNPIALIVGPFLSSLIPTIAILLVGALTLGPFFEVLSGDVATDEEMFEAIFLGFLPFFFITMIISLIFMPFVHAATYTAVHESLVNQRKVSLKEFFQFGFKNYFKYLLLALALMVPSFVIEIFYIMTVFVVSLIGALAFGIDIETGTGAGSAIFTILLGGVYIIYMYFLIVFSYSIYRYVETGSIGKAMIFVVNGITKPLKSLKLVGLTLLFYLVTIIFCVITLGIGLIFLCIGFGLIFLILYEIYLKVFNPELLDGNQTNTYESQYVESIEK